MRKKNTLRKAEESLLGWLFPRVCPLCGEILRPAEAEKRLKKCGNPYICPVCYDKLDFADGQARCMCCSRPLEDEQEQYCRDCSEKIREFDRGISMMLHNDAARKIIYDLKYSSMKDNGDFLAFEAARRIGETIRRMDVDAIIPVPLHRKRLRERGYNQAAEIAKRFVNFMEEDFTIDEEYLVRRKKTQPLKGMSGQERMSSLQGVFAINKEAGRYERVLIVDDIFTTGATLNECAKTLKQAGVNMVYFMTMSIGS
ncbi:MAG: ComF family protein [Lachnospiraceae bacterium]|jgi:ComF family protein